MRHLFLAVGISALIFFSDACSQSGSLNPIYPVYQASRALDGDLYVGVSLVDYEHGIQALSGALLIAGDRISKHGGAQEKKDLADYASILKMHMDASKIWTAQVKEQVYSSNFEEMAKTYGVTPEKAKDGFSLTNADEIREAIWEKIAKKEQALAANM